MANEKTTYLIKVFRVDGIAKQIMQDFVVHLDSDLYPEIAVLRLADYLVANGDLGERPFHWRPDDSVKPSS